MAKQEIVNKAQRLATKLKELDQELFNLRHKIIQDRIDELHIAIAAEKYLNDGTMEEG